MNVFIACYNIPCQGGYSMERIEELKATQKELMDQLNEIGNAINQLLKDARVKDYVEKQNLWDKLMPKYQKI